MVQAHRIKTVAIVGPTAAGKSDIALRLAESMNGELIGADSMQIYRGFDIGTGKLTPSECGAIKHWLIDVANGGDDFSVGNYVELASAAVRYVSDRGKLPIIVGGTGMYVYALLSGCNFASTPKDENTRMSLKILAHVIGGAGIHALLANIDGLSAGGISRNDVKRTIRALEIFALSGAPKSRVAALCESQFDSLTIVLTLPRAELYDRIDARVHKMFDDGLIDEALGLMQYRDCGSMQALGYKQIMQNPSMPRSELEKLVAQKTRNYAKRQMTYFNNMKLDKIFIDARDFVAVERAVREFTEQ